MLVYRPGCTSSCLSLHVGDEHAEDHNELSGYIDLGSLAAAAAADDDHSTRASIQRRQQGGSRASTSGTSLTANTSKAYKTAPLKRSADSSDADDDIVEWFPEAKKPRIEEGEHMYRRVLTHTFHLQPFQNAKKKRKERIDESMLPDALQADLTSFPRIKHDELELVGLPDTTTTFGRYSPPEALQDDIASCLTLLYENTDVVRLKGGRMQKCRGHAPAIDTSVPSQYAPLDFYYSIEVEVWLDLSRIDNIEAKKGLSKWISRQIPNAMQALLSHAFFRGRKHACTIGPIEARSGKKYKEANLEWFYSCLPRPPTSGSYELRVEDRKGKGKAKEEEEEIDVTTGSRPIFPPDLVPRLHPFQSRTLEWMLYREGKMLSDPDADGAHTIKPLNNKDLAINLRRSVIWAKVILDDGEEWWFCPTSMKLMKEDPADYDTESTEGSILAEEMGLGKTVEILSLILLNREPERNLLPVYDATWLAADVRPSGLTLLVCPQAIIGQWCEEIARHAPTLRVLRYSGMKTTYPKDDGKEVERTIKRFDIVICDFDTMANDLTIARKPHLHNTRAQVARGGRVAYRRSVLIGIEWLRVILDEAQMAASTTSAISETASFIPRKYSWAVSGTPIKQTIKDLAGLLKFLRVDDVGESNYSFQKLLLPEYADVFTNLVSKLGVRTIKSQIQDELALPPQERFVVPVKLTPVEMYNYRTKFGEALAEVQAHMDPARLTKDWTVDRMMMFRWLHALRQACFHAQAALQDRARGAVGRRHDEVAVKTLDEILFDLRGKNIAELHSDQRNAATAKVKRAYRMMYDKEDCERYENGLKTLRFAKRDLHLLAQDIYNELLAVFPEARAATPGSRSSSTAPVTDLEDQPYLAVFGGAVCDLAEQHAAGSQTAKAKTNSRIIGALTNRLRDTLFVMHQAVFFIGNAYFNMGDKEEQENAAYAEADALRKQLLHSDEIEVNKEIQKLKTRLIMKKLKEEELEFELSDEPGGLHSHRIFELIDLLSKKANEILALMLRWRKLVIETLLSALTDQEISDTEYQSKAEMQEKLDIYIEYLGRVQADWIQLITGTKSALADNPTTGANANVLEAEAGANVDDVLLEALADPSTSKRSKRKQMMNANNRKAAIAAADPATKLRRELQAERKKVVPSFILQPKKQNTGSRQQAPVEEDEDVEMDDTFDESTSLRDQLRALQRTKDFNLPAAELDIVNTEISRLRKELAEKDKLIEILRSEQNLFADVYNARVKFYRVMQEFGDSVAVLPDEETTAGALRAEIDKLKTRESDLDHQMLPKIARRRYLDGLRNANLTDEGCLICANTEQGQMVLTHCGHCMHEACLRAWCRASGSYTCPVCRASLTRKMAWVKIQVAGNDVKVEEGEQNARAGASSSDKSASTSVNASTGTSPGSDTGNLANSTPNELKPDEMQIEELPEDEDNYDPSKQLNIISQDELDAIDAVLLHGASLGTKLDAIVKHVKLLRQRHQRAIEQYDIAMAARTKEGHPGNRVMEAPPTEAKVLIYSAWQYACEVLAEAFSRERIKHVRLEGYGKKESAVLEFTGNPNCSVFILHAKSQAAGLTLTAASYVFLVEPLLEPALETQAIARVHRIGQKKKTTVFQYMIPDTVDERIGLLSLRKWKHLIFSRAHSTGTVQEPSVATAPTQDRSSNANNSPARRSRYMDTQDKKVNIDGDALTNEDLAMLLLDKEGPVALRNALARVAELKKEHQEAVVRERQERAQLSWEIMRAVAEDPTAANDWEGWDIGLD